MKTLSISIKENKKDYPIFMGTSILPEISEKIDFKKYTHIAIVTDKNVIRWAESIKNILPQEPLIIILSAGEREKNIRTLETIWKKLIEEKFDRKSLVINVGGGVIGDMGGFAAATYMRGIDFIQIPTTLLSMVDASVGGKLAIDFDGYKNAIGSFVQPKAVIIEVNFLTTLPTREFTAGFAEIIKHGLIADKKYLKKVSAKKPREFSSDEMIEIIQRSCEIKSDVVEKDETESGLRKILNFGHTIGHAIESLSLKTEKPLLHGEAIAIGMVAEAKISELIGNINAAEFSQIQKMIETTGLPIHYPGLAYDEIFKIMKMDKKNEKGIFKWTLLKHIGEAIFDVTVEEHMIKKSLEIIISK